MILAINTAKQKGEIIQVVFCRIVYVMNISGPMRKLLYLNAVLYRCTVCAQIFLYLENESNLVITGQ